MSMKVGVLGGGPWGVSLALAARRAGREVLLCTRRQQTIGDCSRISLTTDMAELAAETRLIIIAVPSQLARSVARELGDHIDGSHMVIHGIRGLSGEELLTISQILRDETPARRLGALGGPVQAQELSEGRPSVIIIGSQYGDVRAAVRAAFSSEWLRIARTADLIGLEWASALVGCLSLGIGFAQAAGATPGLLAALISGGVNEAACVAAAAGAEERTLFGLAGYGDLLASMALPDRPEVVVGRALAQGASVGEAQAQAKLRVEAVELIPKLARFAEHHSVGSTIITSLVAILEGQDGETILKNMFDAVA